MTRYLSVCLLLAAAALSARAGPATAPATQPAATAPGATTAPAPAEAATTAPAAESPKPLYAAVVTRDAKAETIRGTVLFADDTIVTIQTAKGPVTHKWIELTTPSACTLRARLIDKTNAQDWLSLATLAWGMGAREQARNAVRQALALDKTLKPATQARLKTEPGSLVKPANADSANADGSAPVTGNEGELFPDVAGHKPH